MACAVIRQRFARCRAKASYAHVAGTERAATPITASNRTTDPSNDDCAMQGPRTVATARIVVQAIEAVHMIRKGQVLGITRHNLYGQAWVFGALLGVR